MKRNMKDMTAYSLAAVFFLAAAPAAALIPEPDVVFYGEAIGSDGALSSGVVTLRLSDSGAALASFTLGSDPQAKTRYVLRVPMDLLEPRTTGAAQTGDTAGIYLDGVRILTVTIPAKGSVVGASAIADTTDTDGDGMPDAWEKRFFGTLSRDGKGDLNHNGISDLAEYQNGSDPGSCVWNTSDDSHLEALVDHPLLLKSCLLSAENDLHHNLIKIVEGGYPGNFSYLAAQGEDFDLRLVGGYSSKDPAQRQYQALLTVLDGDKDGDGVADGRVLTLDSSAALSAGNLQVEGLHLKGGRAPEGGAGGAASFVTSVGSIVMLGNLVSDSQAAAGGGVALSTQSGAVTLANNVVYANTAARAAGLQVTTATGPVTLINNTLGTGSGSSGTGRTLLLTSTGGAVDLANNIVLGSSTATAEEMYLDTLGVTVPLLVRNNAWPGSDSFATTVAGFQPDATNLTATPLLVDPGGGNFHQRADSPTVNAGLSQHASLPARDMDGDRRKTGTAVDIGADERGFSEVVDLNDNGQLDLGDLVAVYSAVLGDLALTPDQQLSMDVAPLGQDGLPLGDGVLDVADVVLLMRRLVGLLSW
jgi:hypothetical protein